MAWLIAACLVLSLSCAGLAMVWQGLRGRLVRPQRQGGAGANPDLAVEDRLFPLQFTKLGFPFEKVTIHAYR